MARVGELPASLRDLKQLRELRWVSVRIGVDELFQAKGMWWCHLVCDDFSPEGLALLHQFAQEIGLPRRAFHDPSGHPRPHYDLRPQYRDLALTHGAEPLGRKELVAYLHRGREKLNSDL